MATSLDVAEVLGLQEGRFKPKQMAGEGTLEQSRRVTGTSSSDQEGWHL